jgi:hypothetical protein
MAAATRGGVVTKAEDAGTIEENLTLSADSSEETRMAAIRLLFRNKYVRQKPDLIATGQDSAPTLPITG